MTTEAITLICGTHRRRAELFWAGGEPRFRHSGPGDGATCASQRFTVRREWVAGRESVITMLLAEKEQGHEHVG